MTPADVLISAAFCAAAAGLVHALAGWVRPGNPGRILADRRLRRMRMDPAMERRLETALPAALERIASGLSAGFSLQQAIDTAARSEDRLLGPVFGRVMTLLRSGQALDQSLEAVAGSFRRRSLALAFHSMASAHRAGTNLVESLQLLSVICRDREILRRKVEAMSSQGRMQGIILTLVPLLFFLSLAFVSPASFALVTGDPMGRSLLLSSFVLQAIGGFIIRRMVRKEIF